MGAFISQFMKDYFTFDSKFFASITPLLINPGFLTQEFFAGRRVRYITPLRLYIFISIIFFLVLSFLGSDGSNVAVDKLISVYFPRLFFVLLPVFAGILHLLHFKRESNYVVHFLFSVHFHAFFFLVGIAYLLISELFDSLDLVTVNQFIAAGVLLAILAYLFIAMKRMYKQKLLVLVWKYLTLLLLYGMVLTIVSLTTLLFLSQS